MNTKVFVPRNVVAKFLRLKSGAPIGLVAATKVDNVVKVSWSFTSKADRKAGAITKNRSWQIALNRAITGTDAIIPHALAPVITEVRERAARYFRVAAEDIVVTGQPLPR